MRVSLESDRAAARRWTACGGRSLWNMRQILTISKRNRFCCACSLSRLTPTAPSRREPVEYATTARYIKVQKFLLRVLPQSAYTDSSLPEGAFGTGKLSLYITLAICLSAIASFEPRVVFVIQNQKNPRWGIFLLRNVGFRIKKYTQVLLIYDLNFS